MCDWTFTADFWLKTKQNLFSFWTEQHQKNRKYPNAMMEFAGWLVELRRCCPTFHICERAWCGGLSSCVLHVWTNFWVAHVKVAVCTTRGETHFMFRWINDLTHRFHSRVMFLIPFLWQQKKIICEQVKWKKKGGWTWSLVSEARVREDTF